ncbi:chymotrypsinogen A [Spodoptera frugiperda]|uniref:Chymotrypsinogen A n=1 Tax=Spodoptera frugiperda TaxID=7108 RepID=A0A9R0F7J6_SPOFR|nr:chymotrypsinogen A [Spodoptera frugiperda]
MTITFSKLAKLHLMINVFFQFHECSEVYYFPYNTTLRVYNGEPATPAELPYQIALKTRAEYDNGLFYTFCGGALISRSKVLTAAHCFVRENNVVVAICQGYTYLQDLTDKYAVAGTLRNRARQEEAHEQWRTIYNVNYPASYKFPEHDIAVLFVFPYTLNDLVKPIKIAKTYENYEGYCLVSGYGEVSNQVTSDTLMKAYVLILANNKCPRVTQYRDLEYNICTSAIGTDIGRGDSGSPLVCTKTNADSSKSNILVGIASGAYPGQNAFFTRVSAYTDYIHGCAKINESSFLIICTFTLIQSYIGLLKVKE